MKYHRSTLLAGQIRLYYLWRPEQKDYICINLNSGQKGTGWQDHLIEDNIKHYWTLVKFNGKTICYLGCK